MVFWILTLSIPSPIRFDEKNTEVVIIYFKFQVVFETNMTSGISNSPDQTGPAYWETLQHQSSRLGSGAWNDVLMYSWPWLQAACGSVSWIAAQTGYPWPSSGLGRRLNLTEINEHLLYIVLIDICCRTNIKYTIKMMSHNVKVIMRNP